MKKIYTILIFLSYIVFSADYQLSVPKEVLLRDQAYLEISSSSFITIIEKKNKENFNWSFGSFKSSNYSSINGRVERKHSTKIGFSISSLGDFIIPDLVIEIDNERHTISGQKVKVVKRKDNVVSEDEAFMRVFFDGEEVLGNKKFELFKDQEINLKVELFAPIGSRVDYPRLVDLNSQFVIAQVFFQRGRKSSLKYIEKYTQTYKGKTYEVSVFEGRLTLVKEGEVDNMMVIAYIFAKNRMGVNPIFNFNTPFSSVGGGKKPVYFYFPTVSISNIPKTFEKGVHNLGLVGDWSVKSQLPKKEILLSYPFHYSFLIEGKNSTDSFIKPEIEFSDFEVIDSQVSKGKSKGKNTVELSYTLMPKKMSSQLPKLKFSYFDTRDKRNVIVEIEDSITVKKPSGQVVKDTRNDKPNQQLQDKEKPKEDSEKETPPPLNDKDKKPFSLNLYPYFYFFVSLLLILFVLIVFYYFRKRKSFQRKKIKRQLLKKVDSLSDCQSFLLWFSKDFERAFNNLLNASEVSPEANIENTILSDGKESFIRESLNYAYMPKDEQKKFIEKVDFNELKQSIRNFLISF